jgi:hypothetical protein
MMTGILIWNVNENQPLTFSELDFVLNGCSLPLLLGCHYDFSMNFYDARGCGYDSPDGYLILLSNE